MTPDQVPAQLADDLAERLYDDDHENCDQDGCHGTPHSYYAARARDLLAAALPAHERMVREQAVARLRDAALVDFGVEPLAAHLWDTCRHAPNASRIDDYPRDIAAAVYRWLADHIEGETP